MPGGGGKAMTAAARLRAVPDDGPPRTGNAVRADRWPNPWTVRDGDSEYAGQVAGKQAFLKRHPEARVWADPPYWHGKARDAAPEFKALELKRVLDELGAPK